MFRFPHSSNHDKRSARFCQSWFYIWSPSLPPRWFTALPRWFIIDYYACVFITPPPSHVNSEPRLRCISVELMGFFLLEFDHRYGIIKSSAKSRSSSCLIRFHFFSMVLILLKSSQCMAKRNKKGESKHHCLTSHCLIANIVVSTNKLLKYFIYRWLKSCSTFCFKHSFDKK